MKLEDPKGQLDLALDQGHQNSKRALTTPATRNAHLLTPHPQVLRKWPGIPKLCFYSQEPLLYTPVHSAHCPRINFLNKGHCAILADSSKVSVKVSVRSSESCAKRFDWLVILVSSCAMLFNWLEIDLPDLERVKDLFARV